MPHHHTLVQRKPGSAPWCSIHGDYELKDVIVRGHETDNRKHSGTIDGVKNYMLFDVQVERVRRCATVCDHARVSAHGRHAVTLRSCTPRRP